MPVRNMVAHLCVIVLVMHGMVSAGLVGYWKFEEGSGTIAHNSVLGGPDGILSGGASFVPTGGLHPSRGCEARSAMSADAP